MYECVDKEKLYFIAITLFPLLGQPLLTRRYERYILLIPYILVNLMSDYRYQHDIFYQYTFGSVALLFYLTTVNLAELRSNFIKNTALAASVSIAALCFLAVNLPKGIQYPIRAIQNYDYYQEIRDTMSTIPDDAAVSASTFYTTHLSQREILYDIRHCSREHILETEYIVLSLTSLNDYKKYESHGKDNGLENLIRMIENSGYTVYDAVENVLIIYRKTSCFPYQ